MTQASTMKAHALKQLLLHMQGLQALSSGSLLSLGGGALHSSTFPTSIGQQNPLSLPQNLSRPLLMQHYPSFAPVPPSLQQQMATQRSFGSIPSGTSQLLSIRSGGLSLPQVSGQPTGNAGGQEHPSSLLPQQHQLPSAQISGRQAPMQPSTAEAQKSNPVGRNGH